MKNSIILFMVIILSFFVGCYSNTSNQKILENNNLHKVDNSNFLLKQKNFKLTHIEFNYLDRLNVRKDRRVRAKNIDSFLKEQLHFKLNEASKNQEKEIYYISINIDYNRKYGEDISSLIPPFVIYKINIFDKNNTLLKTIENNNVIFEKYLSLDESDEKEFIIELIDIIVHNIKNDNQKD